MPVVGEGDAGFDAADEGTSQAFHTSSAITNVANESEFRTSDGEKLNNIDNSDEALLLWDFLDDVAPQSPPDNNKGEISQIILLGWDQKNGEAENKLYVHLKEAKENSVSEDHSAEVGRVILLGQRDPKFRQAENKGKGHVKGAEQNDSQKGSLQEYHVTCEIANVSEKSEDAIINQQLEFQAVNNEHLGGGKHNEETLPLWDLEDYFQSEFPPDNNKGEISRIILLGYGDQIKEKVHVKDHSAGSQVNQNVQTQFYVGESSALEDGIRRIHDFGVLKAIVYGGLVESIASLGLVSSAAGSNIPTLNVVTLTFANLISGLFIIVRNLMSLRDDEVEDANQEDNQASTYWKSLGRIENFRLHVVLVVSSFIIFGLVPPVIYGFTFQKSKNKELKLVAIGVASFLCISMLAIAKAHVQGTLRPYTKTLLFYLIPAVAASGLSYIAGHMVGKFLDELGIFPNGNKVSHSTTTSNDLFEMNSTHFARTSY